jgi:hypothetical protein
VQTNYYQEKKMRNWTKEERFRQSEMIHHWKPWETAGVKTAAGKKISKMNAYKHGLRSADMRKVLHLIATYKKTLRDIGGRAID